MTKDMAKKQGRPAPAPRKVAAAAKKNQAPSLDNRKAKAGWLFVLPFIVSFVVIYIPIVWDSIWFSFNEMTPNMSGYTLEFVGLKNYSDAIFVDSGYVQTLITGIKTLILNVPAIIIFSLFVAIVLNQKMVGRGIFRAILFLPVILCTGLVAKIDQSNALLSELLITEAGCDGVYYCVQGGEYTRFTPEEYKKYIRPSDLYVLEHANRFSENNILHMCGWAGAKNQIALW